MDLHRWHPVQRRPVDLVAPVRIDPSGSLGPTRGQARGPGWTAVTHGWYVETSRRPESTAQRILEQSVRLGPNGAVTAWAALRWQEAGFFDGTASDGSRLPVPLIVGVGSNLCTTAQSVGSYEQFAPWERTVVAGVPCASVRRALFDEIRRLGSVRPAVVAADMTMAAGLLTPEDFAEYVAIRPAWTGVPLVRKVLPLIDAASVSPPESWLRLAWVLDAGLPTPLCNRDLLTESGEFLGRPDLLDPHVGLAGEYDGADHLSDDRRSRDRIREERLRDHGLEVVRVVRGELGRGPMVAARIRLAYERARRSRRPQTWSLAG